MDDSEEKLCRPLSEFGRVCEGTKLRVNVRVKKRKEKKKCLFKLKTFDITMSTYIS